MAVSSPLSLAMGKKRYCGETWGRMEYFLTIGGVCSAVAMVWLVWQNDTFEGLKGLWEENDIELPPAWQDSVANITVLSGAVASGAVCLDGSPPAYFLHRGSGKGINNWLIFLEGGGWCQSDEECLKRSFTSLGSSRYMSSRSRMDGVLSSSPFVNPDFHSWNRVLVKYCDGGSFNGYVEEPTSIENSLNSRYSKDGQVPKIFYRGQRIWNAVMEDLLNQGMKEAQKALLGGCSAGGLASVLHCDQFREILPMESTVKCFSDAGFFLHIPDMSGHPVIEEFYKSVVLLQNMTGYLSDSCTAQRTETQCIFPQYVISSIRTPIFVLNPAYDTWQFANILITPMSDPTGSWKDCKNALTYCTESQLKIVQGFRDELLKALTPLFASNKDGAFIDSCYIHCQAQNDNTWNSGPKVDQKPIFKAVGDWYFGRNTSKVVDCAFPCNPTCGGF